MKALKPEEFIAEMSQGLGEGPLTLGIMCTECNAHYELSKESVAMAVLTQATFLDYIRFVQTSACPNCEKTQHN